MYYPLWHAFLGISAYSAFASLTGHPFVPSAEWAPRLEMLNFLAVVCLMPNALRSFCLNFVSSNMHYYGDVEAGNIVQQTQVWTAAWTLPFHLFCFNFGGTHAIHHFVVNDPFYIRQAIAKDAHQIMRDHGVRFNDFSTFGRDNRFKEERELVAVPAAA
jgi:hypothetical protein